MELTGCLAETFLEKLRPGKECDSIQQFQFVACRVVRAIVLEFATLCINDDLSGKNCTMAETAQHSSFSFDPIFNTNEGFFYN